MLTQPPLLNELDKASRLGKSARLATILRWLMVAILVILLIFYVVLFLWRSYAVLSYHYPVSYGEGTVMSEAARLATGKPIYTSDVTPPYLATNYGPLGYFLDALTLMWAAAPSFLGGRLLSFVACLAVIACLYLAAATKLSRAMALAAALTALATEPIFINSSLYKFDMQSVALSLGAATLIYRVTAINKKINSNFASDSAQNDNHYSQWRSRLNRWSPYLAGLLCACAFLIKQSALAAPAAILIFLAVNAPAKALRFALTLIGVVAVVIAALEVATQGLFWQHFVLYNMQSFSLARLSDWLVYLIQRYFILFGLSMAFILVRFIRAKGLRQKIDLWSIYWLLAVVVSFSSGKVGANLNYYIEVMALSCLLTWWAAGSIWQNRTKLKIGKWQLSLAASGLFLIIVQLAIVYNTPFDKRWDTPTPATTAQAEQIEAAVQQYAAQGPILVEDSGWLLSWKDSSGMDDPFAFKQLYDLGRWNQNGFLEDLRTGKYKYVMIEMWGVKDTDANLDKQVAAHNYSPQPDRFTIEEQKYFRKLFTPVKRIGTIVFLKWNG